MLCENNKQSAAQKGISTSIQHTHRDLFARQCVHCIGALALIALSHQVERARHRHKITPVSDVTFKQRCPRCVVNANVVVAVAATACVVIVHVFYFMLFFSFIFGDSVQVESAYRIVSSVCIFACHCVCASMCVCVCQCMHRRVFVCIYAMRLCCWCYYCCCCCYLLSLLSSCW